MTAQGSRRTVLVIALGALALALAAWSLWPMEPTMMPAVAGAQPLRDARTGTFPADTPGNGGGAAVRSSGAETTDSLAGSGRATDCLSVRRGHLRSIRNALDPAHSAQEAFAHALAGGLLAVLEPRDEDAARHEEGRREAEWQAARRQWPDDLDIAWQAANNCMEMFGCDQDEALLHLLQIDPNNAAAWWLAMREAWGRDDDDAYDEALAHAAASHGSDVRRGSVFLALQPLLANAPIPDRCLRLGDDADLGKLVGHVPTDADRASVEAWSYELASNAFLSRSAFSGCLERKARPLSQRRRADCIASLSVLASGDTIGEQSIALPLLIQLAGDSPEGLAYRERYRRTLYLGVVAPPSLIAGNPASMVSASELETMRHAAIAKHLWPPPADWLPAVRRQRMLISSGRLPVSD